MLAFPFFSLPDFPSRPQVSPGSAREEARRMKLDSIKNGHDRLVLWGLYVYFAFIRLKMQNNQTRLMAKDNTAYTKEP